MLAFCSNCGKETEHRHIHDCAHGIPETHMAGSERYVCAECGLPIYKEAGEKIGLQFVLD